MWAHCFVAGEVNQSYPQWTIHIIQTFNNIMSHLSWQLQIGIKYIFCKEITMHLICSYVLRFW